MKRRIEEGMEEVQGRGKGNRREKGRGKGKVNRREKGKGEGE